VVLADRAPLAVDFSSDLRDRILWRPLDFATANWNNLLEEAAVIHHYAWSSIPASANGAPAEDLATNVAPTLALLEALHHRAGKGAPVLVFASSGGTVYGKLRRVPAHEDHPLGPINAYGAGKATVEMYLAMYRELRGLDCRVARLANPFGAGQDLSRGQGAVTTFLHHALNHRPITIWGDGEVVRDYIHIADAAAGLVALACAPRNQERPWTFNIGSGQGVSLNGIIAELEARLGRRVEVRRESERRFDVPVSILDVTLAREVLGWAPRLTFSEGMTRTLADLGRRSTLSNLD
jgi:UDP-glucose 4-epimerase